MIRKNIVFNLIIITIYCFICHNIFSNQKVPTFKYNHRHNTYISQLPIKETDILGKLSIPKINLNKTIYNSNSNKNNVEKNVTILKGSTLPDNNDSIIFLAAHSGNGNNAYFDNIKHLNKNDKVYFTYKNNTYTYIVIEKREIAKDGYIKGNRYNNKELVLTTCSDNPNKQLIIHCIIDKKDD